MSTSPTPTQQAAKHQVEGSVFNEHPRTPLRVSGAVGASGGTAVAAGAAVCAGGADQIADLNANPPNPTSPTPLSHPNPSPSIQGGPRTNALVSRAAMDAIKSPDFVEAVDALGGVVMDIAAATVQNFVDSRISLGERSLALIDALEDNLRKLEAHHARLEAVKIAYIRAIQTNMGRLARYCAADPLV